MRASRFVPLLLLATFLMGTSFAVIKIAYLHQYASPLMLAAMRFISAGIIMAIIIAILKISHPSQFKDWGKIALIGTFQTAGVMSAIFVSLHTITTSESAILTFINPLFVVILGALFAKLHYRISQWFGVILGIVGMFITLGVNLSHEIGIIIGIAGAISWAIATLLVNLWGQSLNAWTLAAYQMLFGGILILIMSLLFEKPFFTLSIGSMLNLAWLSIASSILQFSIWYYLLLNSDPGKTSSFPFLAPVFGVISGAILLNDPLHISLFTGGILIIVAIYLINRNPIVKAS